MHITCTEEQSIQGNGISDDIARCIRVYSGLN